MVATLDWYGCATFRLQVAGLTIFLDAYIDRAEGAAGPQPPRTADEIDQCDWLSQHLATALDPAARQHLAASMDGHSDRGDGGALVYVFDTPDGRLLYQDTSGHWSGVLRALRVDAAILAAAGRGNIDGEPIQGSLAEFVAGQVELLRPRRVVLSHHDDWLPGFSVDTDVAPIRAAIEQAASDTELLELGYLDGTPILPVPAP